MYSSDVSGRAAMYGAVALGVGGSRSASIAAGRDTVYFGYDQMIDGEAYAVQGESWTFDHGASDPMEGWQSENADANQATHFRQVGAASWAGHGNQVGRHPAAVTLIGRTITWTFAGIELPPASQNEPASHGYVTFQAKSKAGLAAGTQITNQASIVFDFNPPVLTNVVTNTLLSTSDAPVQQLLPREFALERIAPNPANSGHTSIRLALPHPGQAQVTIYDEDGAMIQHIDLPGYGWAQVTPDVDERYALAANVWTGVAARIDLGDARIVQQIDTGFTAPFRSLAGLAVFRG